MVVKIVDELLWISNVKLSQLLDNLSWDLAFHIGLKRRSRNLEHLLDAQ